MRAAVGLAKLPEKRCSFCCITELISLAWITGHFWHRVWGVPQGLCLKQYPFLIQVLDAHQRTKCVLSMWIWKPRLWLILDKPSTEEVCLLCGGMDSSRKHVKHLPSLIWRAEMRNHWVGLDKNIASLIFWQFVLDFPSFPLQRFHGYTAGAAADSRCMWFPLG